MHPVQLVFVGGFPGAGKTTLLAQATRRFFNRGKRVGLIISDQADELVDTGLLQRQGFDVCEVGGSSSFQDFVQAADRLVAEVQPDILIAEIVGSGTDLVASVLRPAQRLLTDHFRIAPFTVLADPARLCEALRPDSATGFPSAVHKAFRRQLEAADLIVLNKTDTLTTAALDQLKSLTSSAFPTSSIIEVSAHTGLGLNTWLDRVSKDHGSGRHLPDVDCATQAEGEAPLGWLSTSIQLKAPGGADWKQLCEDLLRVSQAACASRQAEIAHLKLLLDGRGAALAGNLTGNTAIPFVDGAVTQAPTEAAMTVNARVHMDPEALRRLVEDCVRQVAGDTIDVAFASPPNLGPAH